MKIEDIEAANYNPELITNNPKSPLRTLYLVWSSLGLDEHPHGDIFLNALSQVKNELNALRAEKEKWLKVCKVERNKWEALKRLSVDMNTKISQETIDHQQNIADLLGVNL